MAAVVAIKQELRAHLRAVYRAHDLSGYVPDALRQLVDLQVLRNATRVLAYHPLSHVEIPFIDALHERFSKTEWYFVAQNAHEPMFIDRYGNSWEGACVQTVCIVPSLALDRSGNRLGKGGGFYDRFLQKYPELQTVSVVPDFALLETVPHEGHDVPVRTVIIARSHL